MSGEERLLADLAALSIDYELHEHVAVFTVEESRGIKTDIPGVHTKNLFLRDTSGAFWLLTVPAEARIDLKRLPQAIGCKRVSFGKPDEMRRLIGIEPGSVTPLAMINALPGSISCFLDDPLADKQSVNVHPLRNTATIGLAGNDILRLLAHWGHEPQTASIPKKSE